MCYLQHERKCIQGVPLCVIFGSSGDVMPFSYCSLCEECVEWELLLPQDCLAGSGQVPRWSDASCVLCEWGCESEGARVRMEVMGEGEGKESW